MPLRKKIILTFLVCMIITFIPFIYILHTKIKPMHRETVETQTLNLIHSKANEIGSWLNQRISEIKIIHEFPATKTLDFEELKPYLTKINQITHDDYGNPDETFSIGGLDGKGWVNDGQMIDISNRSYFLELMSSNKPYVISEPVWSQVDNNPIFLISYLIVSDSNEKVGFINGAISLDRITEVTRNIDIYDSFSWIMNQQCDVYTSTSKHLDGDLFPESYLEQISAASDYSPTGIIKSQNFPKDHSTIFYSTVPYAEDWILCTSIENTKLYAQSNEIIFLILTLILFLALCGFILSLIISYSITKPLEKLKQHLLNVSNGDLTTFYEVDGEDEFSVLGTVFNNMLLEINHLIDAMQAAHQSKRRAELQVLQSQINPHFLYNTLDTIQWKAFSYNALDVVHMIQLLSTLFRLSLNNGKETISIKAELEHVETYLAIQKIRYQDKVNYKITTDPLCDDFYIPKLIIQPLVENAIYHGLKPKHTPGFIEIHVHQTVEDLYISIKDDGVGISPEHLEQLNTNLSHLIASEHYGLYNINERLRLTFGTHYATSIKSSLGEGTEILIKIEKKELLTYDKTTHS